jgi:hypothetical protein
MTTMTRSALDAYRPKPCNISPEARERGRALAAESIKASAVEAYADVLPMLRELRAEGLSMRACAAVLNASGFRTRNGANFASAHIHRILERAGSAE